MAHVAVINGSSRGLGLAYVRHLLQHTRLQVVATTSGDPGAAESKILDNLSSSASTNPGHRDRLTCVKLDVLDEASVQGAAKEVQDRFGRGSLRLLINVAGVLAAEKTITKINYDDMVKTFQINTLGHLLAFKHFVPLLPPKHAKLEYDGDSDPAMGLVKTNLSILASMTARVGSIGDNNTLGGWYSYRASKAATNQVIKTLNLELQRTHPAPSSNSDANARGPTNSAIAVALHPGTLLGTDLSKPFVDPNKNGGGSGGGGKEGKPGVHTPERGAEMLLDVIASLDASKGGSYLDYAGKGIPW